MAAGQLSRKLTFRLKVGNEAQRTSAVGAGAGFRQGQLSGNPIASGGVPVGGRSRWPAWCPSTAATPMKYRQLRVSCAISDSGRIRLPLLRQEGQQFQRYASRGRRPGTDVPGAGSGRVKPSCKLALFDQCGQKEATFGARIKPEPWHARSSLSFCSKKAIKPTHIDRPPETSSTAPLMKLASSLARKA